MGAEAKKIYCKGCGKYMGEIRDATLRKGLVCLCGDCETKRIAADQAMKFRKRDPVQDFMDGIFGKRGI